MVIAIKNFLYSPEGRFSVVSVLIDRRPVLIQQPLDQRHVTLLRGEHQGAFSVVVSLVDFRAGFEQRLADVYVALEGCIVQGCPAGIVSVLFVETWCKKKNTKSKEEITRKKMFWIGLFCGPIQSIFLADLGSRYSIPLPNY